jgi:hypothetical protein
MRLGGNPRMNSRSCCPKSAMSERRRPPSALQRFRTAADWIIPGAILVAMPKCPMCLAAYVALFTGVGLSLSTAAHLRVLVLSLCIATLTALVVSLLRQRFAHRG